MTMLSQRDVGTGAGRSFEELLGPASRRYFGEGFRRTSYVLDTPKLSGGALTAAAHITYPPDWSQKDASARVPHLSTIDAAILSICMTEAYLAGAKGLTESDIATTWIESLSVRAGTAPLETMRGVAMMTTADSASRTDEDLHTSLSHRIGPMRATTVVRHPRGSRQPRRPSVDAQTLTDLYYGSVHSGRVLELHPHDGFVTCALTLRATAMSATGLESAFRPSVTAVDALVLAGQMAQILLYARYDTQRDATSTLWMRKVSISTQTPARPPATVPSSMHVTKDRTLHLGDRTLHGVDVVVPDLFGFNIESSLAL